MKKTLIYTACMAALSSSSAFAQSQGTGELQGCVAEPEDKVTNVYFGNGVGNTEADGHLSVANLRLFYKARLEALRKPDGSDFGKFSFQLAYNPTSGVFRDVNETLVQKANEVGASSLNGFQISRIASGAGALAGIGTILGATAVAVGAIAASPVVITALGVGALVAVAADITTRAQTEAMKTIPEVQRKHVALYSADLLAGKRVFVVAHSQGNLFANTSLAETARIRPDDASSLAMVGVATPAARQFRDSLYVTGEDDTVINDLRRTDNVLRANVNNVDGSTDVSGRDERFHGFLESYMENESFASRKRVDKEMERLAREVPFPTQEGGEGAIRATLTWDAQPDVDLHAFEPNGSHVYYSSRTGRSGTLDVDDTSSYGPENYFVPCNKVELGTYRIGVNYFRGTGPRAPGSGPSTATVALFLGDDTIPSPKTVVLPAPRGRAGNGSPQILFTIQVTENVDPQTQKRSAVYTVQ